MDDILGLPSDTPSVGEGTYRARVEPHELQSSLIPSEQGTFSFYVTNEGTACWPTHPSRDAVFRLTYHWEYADGQPATEAGDLTSFPQTLKPGDQVLVPMQVIAPAVPNSYLLVVDVVHVWKRWFRCPCRVAVQVAFPSGTKYPRMLKSAGLYE